jgi:hypothetical protein
MFVQFSTCPPCNSSEGHSDCKNLGCHCARCSWWPLFWVPLLDRVNAFSASLWGTGNLEVAVLVPHHSLPDSKFKKSSTSWSLLSSRVKPYVIRQKFTDVSEENTFYNIRVEECSFLNTSLCYSSVQKCILLKVGVLLPDCTAFHPRK